ncbi:MAG TPA: ferredoxin reductase [Povalibacter sp.]
MSRLQWQQARLTSIVQQTLRIKSFFFSLPQRLTFAAGQHVDVRLTAEDGYQAQRSYSIASAPESPGDLELVIDRLDDGEVSPFFHDVALVGDEFELRGPIGGYFNWSVDSPGAVLLVGGGSGVVPLMSMVRHRAARQSRIPMTLLLSVRGWDDMAFRTELEALHRLDDGFRLIVTTTRSPAQRPGDYDRRIDPPLMTDVLRRMPVLPENFFVCGSDPFVEAAAQGLIEAAVSADAIRTERYGG